MSETGVSDGVGAAAVEPPPSAAAVARTDGVVRSWSAEEIGKRVGKTPRAVRRWTEAGGPGGNDPCPCDRRMHGKREVLRFSLDEVLAWMRTHGLGEARGGDPTPVFDLMGGTAAAPAAAPGVASTPTASPAMAMVEFEDDVELGHEREAFRETLGQIRSLVGELQRALRSQGAAAVGPLALSQLAKAAQNASQEIRQLDGAELEAAKKRRELVARRPVEEGFVALAGDFIASLGRLETEAGSVMKAALAERGCLKPEAAGEGELVERVVRAALRTLHDRERAKLAGAMDAAARVEQREAA